MQVYKSIHPPTTSLSLDFDLCCMSPTTGHQHLLPTLALEARSWDEISFQENFVVIALAFALYGRRSSIELGFD